MKKLFLSILLAAATTVATHAQYFQSIYGSSDTWEFLTDGNNAYSGGNTGHFLIGPGGWSFVGDYRLNVQRTDMDGNIGAPSTFNRSYYLTPMSGTLPADFNAKTIRSLEYADGSGFGIAGAFHHKPAAQDYGIFYTFMDPNGNIVSTNGYFQNLFGTTYNNVEVQEITESIVNPNQSYITGFLRNAGTGKNRVFVIKVDQMGALLWGATYELSSTFTTDSDKPFDIVENTDFNPNCNCNEVLVVGEHIAQSVGIPEAFILRISNINGVPVQPADFYGTPTSSDVFTSIIKSTNPNVDPNSSGFVLAGQSNMGPSGTVDMWFVAIDNGGAIVWDNLFDYNSSQGNVTHDYASDVIERINTQGAYEYYITGYTSMGDFGSEDVLVIKADDFGNGVTGGQFTYGDVDPDRGVRVDQLNGYGPDNDGIAVYGYSWNPLQPLGSYDHYLVKAYFNGVSACQYDLRDPFQYSGGTILTPSTTGEFWPSTFYDFFFEVGPEFPLQDYQICYTQNDPDGSNARVAPVEPKGEKQAIISPNPIAQGTSVATIEVETDRTTTVQVAIYDMLGKQYYSGDFSLVRGKNQLPVNISNTNMAAGMYTVKVSGAYVNKNIMLMVK